ncbi:MAG: AAA family ATPase [Actinomycetota bacterium]|nr:AAA family ATPase [Actinomycetota bacterium]
MSARPYFEFGTVWAGRTPPVHQEYPSRREQFERALAALAADPPRSVVVVGEHGVGTQGFAREIARRRKRQGHVLEASPFQVSSGMRYTGDLEGRVESLVSASAGGRLLWFVPAFHEVAVAGAWDRDPHGLLGKVAPHIASGALRIVGETTTEGWAAVSRRRAELVDWVEVVKLEPLTREEAREAACDWLRHAGLPQPAGGTLDEALTMAAEQLGDALPGPLLRLLAEAARARGGGQAGVPLEVRDLLEALSRITGLARVLFDTSAHLDLEDLQRRFDQAVIGQPEAVTAIVERLAMVKAGLVHPARPLGVFLFAGPTGTGKTEMAKQLASFLGGRASSLIRFDMSEYQGPEAVNRLLGNGDAPSNATGLVAAVSARPASVVLLDEFEKADPSVWDLFLQIFDDARVSDSTGNVADFRHAMIVMTSNIGAGPRASTEIGFRPRSASKHAAARSDEVPSSIGDAFRPELVNRIDRIVVFRPLARRVMRQIVRKELGELEQLRGLRTRPWAIEWDDSAVEALLREGFTADLGARPLKRAIDRHVLAPLARSIVGRAVPEGDQFLFVRAGSQAPIEVQFVDPDTPDEPGAAVRPRADTALGSARAISLDPLGTTAERNVLVTALDALSARTDGMKLGLRKESLLASMSADGFWNDPGRQQVLTEVERLDRLEAGLRTATGLADRLSPVAGRAGAAELTRLLAQRIFLLQEELTALAAGAPRDARLLVRATAGAPDQTWPQRLVDMYRAWAHLRGMAVEDVAQVEGGLILDITGFAAHRLLSGETGLHVWEEPNDRHGRPERHTALVVGAPQSTVPSDLRPPNHPTVVRHYRELPSALVRDSTRGWRTGRLGAVLAGNFDLIEATTPGRADGSNRRPQI